MIYFHIDVNNAFLSWTAIELMDDLKKDIRKIPAIISGNPKRRQGVVLAKSPVSKSLGIKTGETIQEALRKCPSLEMYPPDYEMYEKKSLEFFNFLSQFTPEIERYSIDECFLKFSGFKYIYEDFFALAKHIQSTIFEKYGYTVNIGIGPNKLLAKMASDFEKPNKIHTLFEDELEEKFYPLPVDSLFMVGMKTAKKLKSMGILTIKDLSEIPLSSLRSTFNTQGDLLFNYSHGIDYSDINMIVKDEGLSSSNTLKTNTKDEEILLKNLQKQAAELGRKLRKKRKYTNVITIWIRYYDFTSFTKQTTLPKGICTTKNIFEEAKKLFDSLELSKEVRGIGIRLSSLSDRASFQVSLDEVDEIEDLKTQNLIDEINENFGSNLITLASFLHKK